MAGETEEPETEQGLERPEGMVVFSNNSFIDINVNDVSVTFVYESNPFGKRVANSNVRVVFSHVGFIDFVRFAQSRLDFFEEVYGENLPSLRSVNQDTLRQAAQRMYGELDETTEGESK